MIPAGWRWLERTFAYPDDHPEQRPPAPAWAELEGIDALRGAVRDYLETTGDHDPPEWVVELAVAALGLYDLEYTT